MSPPISSLRLQDAWRECERNVYHLCRALDSLHPILPLTAEGFEHLSDAEVQTLDQFILRFTKLQDAMGTRVFPAVLEYLQEPYEERPMLARIATKLKTDHPTFELGKPLLPLSSAFSPRPASASCY